VAFTESQISERFNKNLNIELSNLHTKKCLFGVFEKEKPELIGLCMFLFNEKNENELGYRFRANYWEKGYGTETTKGLLDYYFKVLKVDKVTADVNTINLGSVKILEKFMTPVKEFFNKRDNCLDRRYEVNKNHWLKKERLNIVAFADFMC
jgi:ribosomal-protein-alanine N-acetyltransferase